MTWMKREPYGFELEVADACTPEWPICILGGLRLEWDRGICGSPPGMADYARPRG